MWPGLPFDLKPMDEICDACAFFQSLIGFCRCSHQTAHAHFLRVAFEMHHTDDHDIFDCRIRDWNDACAHGDIFHENRWEQSWDVTVSINKNQVIEWWVGTDRIERQQHEKRPSTDCWQFCDVMLKCAPHQCPKVAKKHAPAGWWQARSNGTKKNMQPRCTKPQPSKEQVMQKMREKKRREKNKNVE